MPGLNLRAFARDENGSLSVLALFIVLISLTVSGLSVDIHRMMVERARLHNAVDTAAHAALYIRETDTSHHAKLAAIDTTDSDKSWWSWRQPVTYNDITFGNWDEDTRAFTADIYSKEAVRVRGYRVKSRYNEVHTTLLTLVGIEDVELSHEAVFATYYPACMTEGLVAEGVVDIQSNNSVFNGFCIHSNSYVSVNMNNYFEPGTIVSMPDISSIDLPRSGFKKNEGLEMALRNGSYRIRAINLIDDILEGLEDGDSEYMPSYVGGTSVITVSKLSVVPADFTPGRAHKVSCPSGGTLTLGAGVYTDFALWTDCKVKLNKNAELHDVVIGTTDTGADSFSAPSTLVLGTDDDCASGGGASLITQGGFKSASDLHMYGSQILAAGDIEFAANAEGIEGASMIAGGTISGTSNMNLGYCNNEGMEDTYRARFFRMVK